MTVRSFDDRVLLVFVVLTSRVESILAFAFAFSFASTPTHRISTRIQHRINTIHTDMIHPCNSSSSLAKTSSTVKHEAMTTRQSIKSSAASVMSIIAASMLVLSLPTHHSTSSLTFTSDSFDSNIDAVALCESTFSIIKSVNAADSSSQELDINQTDETVVSVIDEANFKHQLNQFDNQSLDIDEDSDQADDFDDDADDDSAAINALGRLNFWRTSNRAQPPQPSQPQQARLTKEEKAAAKTRARIEAAQREKDAKAARVALRTEKSLDASIALLAVDIPTLRPIEDLLGVFLTKSAPEQYANAQRIASMRHAAGEALIAFEGRLSEWHRLARQQYQHVRDTRKMSRQHESNTYSSDDEQQCRAVAQERQMDIDAFQQRKQAYEFSTLR